MDNVAVVDRAKRIVGIFYVVAALVLGLFLSRVLEDVFIQAGVNDFRILDLTSLSGAIGYGVALVAAILIWRIPRTQQVSLDVALELGRVTWPSARETRAATIAVIVASLIAALILGLFDYIWMHVANLVYGTTSVPR
jgi:preprotein translocase subunit SecE